MFLMHYNKKQDMSCFTILILDGDRSCWWLEGDKKLLTLMTSINDKVKCLIYFGASISKYGDGKRKYLVIRSEGY